MHTLRTLVTEAWREASTWVGAAFLALAGLLAVLFPADVLTEWTGRLNAAAGLIGAALVLWRQGRGACGR